MSQGPPRDPEVAVHTWPVRVRVFARNGAEINGYAHVHADAYRGRLSDLLNVGQLRYLAITDATYTLSGQERIESACVLVNTDDVVLLDVSPVTGEELERARHRDTAPPGTSL